MASEFKIKNGLIVVGDVSTSGTITINGALAATQSWVTSQAYLTSSSLTSYATQSYVTSAIASLVDSAPGALDTLRELATALGNDASFSTTVTNSIAAKLPLAGGTLTGALSGTSATFSGAVVVGNLRAGITNTIGWTGQGGFESITDGNFRLYNEGRNTYGNLTLGAATLSGALTGTSATFSGNVTLGNNSDLVFQDLAGTFPTTGKGFDWTLNNDGARIYAYQPSSDSIDFVFQLRDNATTNDRFVFWVDEWQGPAYDKYPLIISGGTEFDLKDSALYTNTVLRLSNSGVLQNVTGNISMFTNNSGYLTSYSETDTLASVTGRGATTSTNISVNSISIGTDATYGAAYRSVSFGYNGDGSNRIFAANNTSDGMYFAAATGQGFNFRPNGGTANLIVINSSGSLGIGTSSPSTKLNIYSDTTADGILVDILSRPRITLRDRGNSDTIIGTGDYGLDDFFIDTYSGNALAIKGSTRNVGIGTSSPNEKLHVAGNINAYVNGGIDAGLFASTSAGSTTIALRSNGITHFNGGSVGIGTTGPSDKLSVNGNIGVEYAGYFGFYRYSAGIHTFSTDGITSAMFGIAGGVFSGRSDAGLTVSGYDQLRFYTENSERIRINRAGKVSIGTTDTNSDKSDFTVYTGSGASLALTDDQVRMGGADVNWGVALRSYGALQTYGQALTLNTQAGNYTVNVQPNGTTVAQFYQDYSYFPGLDFSISRVNGVHSSNYFRGDGSHLVIGTGGTLYLNYGGNSTLLTGSLNVSTSLTVNQGIGQNNLVGRPYAVWGASGTTTGAVVIKFPGNTGNYGMIHAVIDIYEYSGNTVSTIIVGGHNWGSQWYNYGANLVGQTDKQVRVAVVDGAYAIVIGDNSSSWSYGQVVLRKIQNGSYYQNAMNVSEGYTLTQTASLTTSWISGDLRKLTVSGQINASGGDSSQWNSAYSWGNHANAGYLTSVSDVWVNTTGDTMTGNLNFGATSNLGLTWGLNTDAAFIKFVSTGNGAGQSYLEIGTQDDLDEEIKFTQSGSLRFYLATDGFLKNGSGYKYVFENGTWGINISGNAATATTSTTSTTFASNRTNYKNTTDNAVAGQLMWKNYGNNHTIFDASQGTSPDGGSISNTNSAAAWTGTYPTLMGWNGSQTYGVRVDSARLADTATTAGALSSMNISQFTNNSNYLAYGNYSWTSPVFGQYGIKSNLIDNVLYSAADRFEVFKAGVAWNSNAAFNLNYDSNADTIPVNTSRTYSIVLNTKGNPSYGVVYTEGNIYLSFYYTFIPGSVSGRVRFQNGTWVAMSGWTNVSNNGSLAVWRSNVPGGNYMVEIEITINANSSNDTWFAQWEYVMGRPGQYELGIFNKAQDNSVWRSLYFLDSSNVARVTINSGGISANTVTSNNFNVSNAIYFGAGNNYLNWTNGRVYSNVGIETAGIIYASGGNSTNWNTAYSWGNHASAGYLTSVSDVWVNTTGDTMTGSLTFASTADNVRIQKNGSFLNLRDPYNNIHLYNTGDGIYIDSNVHYWRSQAGTHWVALNSTGLGVGTTSPESKLHVSGGPITLKGGSSTDQQIVYNYAREYVNGIYNSSGHFRLQDNSLGGTVYQWDGSTFAFPNGNVGIGTTSPAYKLDISGNSRTTGIHYVDTYLVTPYIYGGGPITMGNNVFINSTEDGKLTLRVPSGDSTEWNYINFTGSNGVRDAYLGTDGGGTPTWYRDDNGVNITLSSSVLINGNTAWHAGNDGSGSGLDADLLDGLQASVFVRNDIYNSAIAGLKVFRNIGTIDGSWPNSDHTFSLENSDAGNIVINFHRGGYTSNNLRYNGSQFRFDAALESTGIITATGGNSTNWNTAYGWGNHASASYATTSYVTTQINNLIAGAPGALDTLDELAAALGDDASFATTVTNSIAAKLPLAGGTMTGDLVIGVGASIGSSQPFGDFSQLRFDNLHSDTNRGPNKIVMHDNGGSWIGGFGIHSDTVSYYTGGHHRWYKTNSPTSSSQVMQLDASGNLTIGGALTESSSIKLKENVKTSEGNLEKVVNLRPVTYNKIGSQTKELGLIAEEVATVYPEFVQYDESGEPVGVNYSRLTAALIGAVKELTQRIETLENNG